MADEPKKDEEAINDDGTDVPTDAGIGPDVSRHEKPTLQDWNFQSFAIMQAMLGVMSPNFRRITLGHDGSEWIITFELEREDAEDLEEIEDFGPEWDALQSGPEPRNIRTVVTSATLPWPASPTRVLYLRREAVSDHLSA